MKYIKEKLDGVYALIPDVYEDKRGYFFESFNPKEFDREVSGFDIVQENESRSKSRVLRGLHYQLPPYNQAKLIRVTNGMVIDIVVDIRTDSPTFGQHLRLFLCADDNIQIFVPRGFAHGFVAMSKNVKFQYKVDNYYSKEHDTGILYNDLDLNIDWEIQNPIVSDKDKKLGSFKDAKVFESKEYWKNP